ncbi:MAG TPA: glycosyltransferase family 2 protein [Verrucomicrobiae bacterium]|jgi:glycosyltransferase involved in cell wall biosynthesis|nr:glycosyltransferase family 2 protein [Verrucomicrobiae bacterium]
MAEDSAGAELELTILMPCLDEAATLAICIGKARDYLARSGIAGEVVIADNGSTDGSQAIAAAAGARVIPVAARGYGAALQGGIRAARGRCVIMGDADDSYDFSALDGFVAKLREGYALVVGNRFRGGIRPGAMPFLNRYLGNPVLSFIGALLFKTPIADFHCGLRGFDRRAILDLGLVMPGMEFASEMVVKAAMRGLKTAEVPIVLHPDGRGRPPHLRPWRDGWRHLKFLLMHSPRWLYLYPGLVMAIGGLGGMILLAVLGSIRIFGIELQVHSMLAAGIIGLLGMQTLSFAVLARELAQRRGFLPPSPMLERFWRQASLERAALAGTILLIGGLIGLVVATIHWAAIGFGNLDLAETMRAVVPSLIAMGVGLQLVLSAFLAGILELPAVTKEDS